MTNRRTFIRQTALGAIGVGLIYIIPGCRQSSAPSAPAAFTALPRSTPEAQGIPSETIRNFLAAVEKSGQEFHGFMVVRHGYVVAEGWWSPFAPEYKHTLYSLSKSFTSTAIGLCVADGKLTVEDPVTKFFPGDLPAEISPNLAAMKVKHLLTMNNGHDGTPTDPMQAMRTDPDGNWPRGYLAHPIPHEPGTHFFYNTASTYMLSNIVQRLTGKTTFDFLSERLFKPLNITDADWEVDPKGVNVGGYGLRIRNEDIAKFGQLYLQKGQWNLDMRREQLIPAAWVDEATSKQTTSQDNDSDWGQGYGYQFWRCKPEPGFYRGDGAFGQYCIVIPQYDTVIAINSESKDMGASMQVVWDTILPALKNEAVLPEDEATQKLLAEDLKKLTLPVLSGKADSPVASQISGKEFALDKNVLGAESIAFSFENGTCKITVKGGKSPQTLTCGMGYWHSEGNEEDITISLSRPPISGSLRSKVAANAAWQDDESLLIKKKFIENVHGDLWTCRFDGDKVRVSFLSSIVAMGDGKDSREDWTGG